MQQRNYEAVFFDLDGTLLPLDMDRFLKGYFQSLSAFAAERGEDPTRFFEGLKSGVKAMLEKSLGTNEERFWAAFAETTGKDDDALEAAKELFYTYYATAFNDLGAEIEPDPAAAEAIRILREKGYPLYLTTMPLFPREAVEARLRWAGVPVDAFERITTFDNSSSTKPHQAYYQETIDASGANPHNILMVGNNTLEDMAALNLGLDGYLVTDWLLDPIDFDITQIKHGSLSDFARFVGELPDCEA